VNDGVNAHAQSNTRAEQSAPPQSARRPYDDHERIEDTDLFARKQREST
jgi:hypothetical protein